MFLDHAAERTRAEVLVIALLGEPFGGRVGELERDAAIGELGFELKDELLDNAADHVRFQTGETDDGVETVSEFRREQLFDGRLILAFPLAAAEADGFLGGVGGAGVGGHDQDDVAAVDLLAVRVRDLTVIHHLEQDVEYVRVGLLDFIEQQDRMRMLVDGVRQLTALIIANIARRGAQ